MKRNLLVTVLFVFCIYKSYSQKENNNWYFGVYASITFNTIPPSSINNHTIFQDEGSASISDENGNLLFYTDGVQVWNKNNIQMPNGFALMGDYTSTQSALIVPKPCNKNIYYIFTTSSFTGILCYSIIDMNLNGGLGDVTTKNFILHNPDTEKLTGTLQSNNIDYWVLAKEFGTNNFLAYSVTALGVQTTPIVTQIGNSATDDNDVTGYMKVSPNGKKIACASNYVELFDFDNTTGILSNEVYLPVVSSYGVEFSPDNSKLYTSSNEADIIQFDLLAGSVADIQASARVIAGIGNYCGIQLGPDDKIYITSNGSSFLHVINNPNLLYPNCNYADKGVNVIGCRRGLPNCIKKYSTCGSLTVDIIQTTCNDNNGSITATASFGIPPYVYSKDGINFQSDNIFENLGAGNYTITAKDANGVIKTKPAIINQSVSLAISTSITDALDGSTNGSVIITANSGTPPYQYSKDAINFQPENIFQNLAAGNYTVTVKDAAGCMAVADITIKSFKEVQIYVPKAFTPNNDGLNDIIKAMPVGIKQFKYFSVYNRYGQLVFTTTDYNKGWDGKFKGAVQLLGTFTWIAEGIDYNGKNISRKGNVILLK